MIKTICMGEKVVSILRNMEVGKGLEDGSVCVGAYVCNLVFGFRSAGGGTQGFHTC